MLPIWNVVVSVHIETPVLPPLSGEMDHTFFPKWSLSYDLIEISFYLISKRREKGNWKNCSPASGCNHQSCVARGIGPLGGVFRSQAGARHRLTQQADTFLAEEQMGVEGAQEESRFHERKTVLWEEKRHLPQVAFGICKGSSHRQESTAGLT